MKKLGLIIFLLVLNYIGISQTKPARTIFDNVEIVLERMELLNSVGSDISPVMVDDELYYSSIREAYLNKPGLDQKNKAFYSIYSVHLDKSGLESTGRKIVAGFGGQLHEGPASYCKSTDELFVTLSNTINPDTLHRMISSEKIRLRLVIMKRVDGEWKISQEFPFNDDRYNFAHPAISQTGDTLVFCSDMDSLSYGKNDLYMSVRKTGKWSNPQNLGPRINTSGNEMFPVFLPGGLLSFASSQHMGNQGGLDIFYTSFPNVGEIVNVGNLINSGFDDFGLTVDGIKGVGYFSSNRPGKGSDDIFSVQFKKLYRIFKGRVLDEITGLPIKNASAQLLDCSRRNIDTAISNEKGEFVLMLPDNTCLSLVVSKDKYETVQKDITASTDADFRLKKHEDFLSVKITDKSTGEIIHGASFEVLNGVYEPGSFDYDQGLFKFKIDIGSNYVFYVSKEGYLPNGLKYIPEDKGTNGYSLVIPLEKISVGKQFVLENLYYDLNKATIRTDAAQVLDRLIKILNDNPKIRIEIGSHTDCRASDAYNLKLSQARSESVVAYLVSKGISPKRLVAKGYGETQLVNKCADGVTCSEQEHQANRRTVVSILDIK